jgi:exonuclease III
MKRTREDEGGHGNFGWFAAVVGDAFRDEVRPAVEYGFWSVVGWIVTPKRRRGGTHALRDGIQHIKRLREEVASAAEAAGDEQQPPKRIRGGDPFPLDSTTGTTTTTTSPTYTPTARCPGQDQTERSHVPANSTKPRHCRVATINIRAGHGTAAHNLQAVAKEGDEKQLDIICCTETKISSSRHATHAGSFSIFASETSTQNRGGVAFFVRQQADDGSALPWSAEDPKVYETNVVGVTLVTGTLRRRLIGVYLSPSEITEETWAALRKACDEAVDPVWLLGDFNADLHSIRAERMNAAMGNSTDTRSAEIQAFVASMGCEDFARTKLERRRTGVWTWSMKRMVDGVRKHVKSVCDYILGPIKDPVSKHRVRCTTLIQTDHRMVYADLRCSAKEHREYLRGRKRFPGLRGPKSAIDIEYAELVELQERQQQQIRKARPSWISEATWALIRARQAGGNGNDTDRPRRLKRAIRRMLKADRMKRFDAEASLIEAAIEGNRTKEGFQMLSKWYKRAAGVQLPMSHQRLSTVSTEYTALYAAHTPTKPMFSLEESISKNFEVADGPLSSDEIRAAAKRMKAGKAPGPNRFRSDTVRRWAHAEEGTTDAACFDKLAGLCQKIYASGEVPMAMRQGTLVLLPKPGKDEFRGITLLDVAYKLISSCLNARAQRAISFHDGIHGFRSGRGCQTALYEAKADMDAREAAGRPYHQIFLDLSKAFDTVNRERLLIIMRAYGFGPRSMRFFEQCWRDAFVAPRAGGVHGPRVPIGAGVRQGDVISPLLFNLVVDAILRLTDRLKPHLRERVQKVFYADDGRTGGEDATEVQEVQDVIDDLFERVGLFVNTSKTVSMTNALRFRPTQLHPAAVLRAQLGRPEYQKRWLAPTECPVCEKALQNRALRRHCLHAHPDRPDTHHHPRLWTPLVDRGDRPTEFTAHWNAVDGQPCRITCPDPDCAAASFTSPSELRIHWALKMHEGTLRVFDNRGDVPVESVAPHQCPRCKVWRKSPASHSHFQSKLCRELTDKRRATDRAAFQAEEQQRSPFKHKGTALTKVSQFPYLGRTLTATNDDTLAVQRNIAKAKAKWAEMRRILGSKPIRPATFVRFYKAVVLNVLLYGAETWKVREQTAETLEAFHNRCVRTIMRQPVRQELIDGEQVWIRPPIQPLLTATKLKPLAAYICARKANLTASYGGRRPADRVDLSDKSYVLKRRLVFDDV